MEGFAVQISSDANRIHDMIHKKQTTLLNEWYGLKQAEERYSRALESLKSKSFSKLVWSFLLGENRINLQNQRIVRRTIDYLQEKVMDIENERTELANFHRHIDLRNYYIQQRINSLKEKLPANIPTAESKKYFASFLFVIAFFYMSVFIIL